jgi:NAD(P)H dehydrogenase (quinone)
MKISLILAHPNPESFNHAIARSILHVLLKHNHEVFYHDLYAENFDPRLPYEELNELPKLLPKLKIYCDELVVSDGIIIVHPNWWGQPPAILKGWVDRIFRADIAYKFQEGDKGEGIPIGLLKAKVALVFNTSNTPTEREEKIFGDPLENLWKKCIFELCGIKVFYRKMFRTTVTSTLDQRRSWLKEVERTVESFFI